MRRYYVREGLIKTSTSKWNVDVAVPLALRHTVVHSIVVQMNWSLLEFLLRLEFGHEPTK